MIDTLTWRIISGPAPYIEEQVNRLAESYSPLLWSIYAGTGEALITVVLINQREMRRAALMSQPQLPGRLGV